MRGSFLYEILFEDLLRGGTKLNLILPVIVFPSIVGALIMVTLVYFFQQLILLKRRGHIFLIIFTFITITFCIFPNIYAYAPNNVINESNNQTNGSVGPLSANTPFRDLLADGPWRVEPGESQLPIYLLVKDVYNLFESYSLDHIEIYADMDGDGTHETFIKNVPYNLIIFPNNYPGFYTIGDWHNTTMADIIGTDEGGAPYDLA